MGPTTKASTTTNGDDEEEKDATLATTTSDGLDVHAERSSAPSAGGVATVAELAAAAVSPPNTDVKAEPAADAEGLMCDETVSALGLAPKTSPSIETPYKEQERALLGEFERVISRLTQNAISVGRARQKPNPSSPPASPRKNPESSDRTNRKKYMPSNAPRSSVSFARGIDNATTQHVGRATATARFHPFLFPSSSHVVARSLARSRSRRRVERNLSFVCFPRRARDGVALARVGVVIEREKVSLVRRVGARLSRASRETTDENEGETSWIAHRRRAMRERVEHAHGGASKDRKGERDQEVGPERFGTARDSTGDVRVGGIARASGVE